MLKANGHLYGFVFVLSSGLRKSRLNWELCFRSQRIPSTLLSPTKKSLRRNQRSFRSEFLLAPSASPNCFLLLTLFLFLTDEDFRSACVSSHATHTHTDHTVCVYNGSHHSFAYCIYICIYIYKFQNSTELSFGNVLYALKGENYLWMIVQSFQAIILRLSAYRTY